MGTGIYESKLQSIRFIQIQSEQGESAGTGREIKSANRRDSSLCNEWANGRQPVDFNSSAAYLGAVEVLFGRFFMLRREQMMQEEVVLQLKARIRDQLDLDNAMSDEAFMERIEQTVFHWSRSHLLPTAIEKVKLVRRSSTPSTVLICFSL